MSTPPAPEMSARAVTPHAHYARTPSVAHAADRRAHNKRYDNLPARWSASRPGRRRLHTGEGWAWIGPPPFSESQLAFESEREATYYYVQRKNETWERSVPRRSWRELNDDDGGGTSVYVVVVARFVT
ncbi:hypothetical protein MTO96_010888 [Rhipicephalus appendiculatus]